MAYDHMVKNYQHTEGGQNKVLMKKDEVALEQWCLQDLKATWARLKFKIHVHKCMEIFLPGHAHFCLTTPFWIKTAPT